jgi:hypothetical protein
MRRARMGERHHEVAHRKGCRSLDEEYLRAGARGIDPYTCQCLACIVLYWKNLNLAMDRHGG